LAESYELLQKEHEFMVAKLQQLEQENKRQLEEMNNLLKESKKNSETYQEIADLNNKLKAATDKLNSLTAEKTKLEGYLRTAKTVRFITSC
jgi:hypothetical protein